MTRPPAPARSRLAVLLVTVFVDLVGFGIVLPLLPYYAREFQASGLTVGLLVAIYSAMQLLCAPLWGRWSDRIGRRPVMLISLAGSTISYLLFGLADGIGLLFVSRVLAGVAGANISVAQAFVADTTTDAERARGMGMIGAAFGLGFIFGPVIGGVLAHYGHHAPGLAASLICGLNLVAAWWRLPESLPPGRRHVTAAGSPWRPLAAAMAQPQLALPLLLFAAAVFTFATMETTLSLLCATRFNLSPSQIYWLFGFLGLTTTITQGGLIGRLAQRFNEPSLALIGTALLALGMAVTPFAPPAWRLLLALAAIAVGQGITSPVLASLISKSGAPQHASGSVMGVSQSAGSLARILGPLWGGVAFERLGPGGPFVTTAALLVLIVAVFGATGRLRLQAPAAGTPPA